MNMCICLFLKVVVIVRIYLLRYKEFLVILG
jgi:hypothetical protein